MPDGVGARGLSAGPWVAGWRQPAAAWAPPRPAAPWSFALLIGFLIVMFSNLPLVVPALAPFAPAQTLALGALAVVAVERTLARRPFRLAWPDSHLLLAFFGFGVVAAFAAIWPRYALEGALRLGKFVAIYLLLVNTVESWPRLRRAAGVLALGGLFPAIGALRGWAAGRVVEGERLGWIGIFENPNDLAYALVVLFPLVLALAIDLRGWRRLALIAVLALYSVTIFMTYSRGGLLGFGVVVLLCLVRWTPLWLVPLALLVLGGGALGALGGFWQRDQGFGGLSTDRTVNERLDSVRTGMAMFEDRPLLGVGFDCSEIGWPKYAPPDAVTGQWLHVHNTPVQVLAETGIVGLTLLLALFGAALVKAHRSARWWRAAGAGDRYRLASALEISVWGFLACGLAGGHLWTWFPYLLLGLIAAAAALTVEHFSRG